MKKNYVEVAVNEGGRTCIIVDSGTDLLGTAENVQVVPMQFISKDRVYRDGDLSDEDFDKKLEDGLPTTSGPTPHEYALRFIEAVEKGYRNILCLTTSSGISNSFNSANLAVSSMKSEGKLRGIEIEVVDTHTLSMPVGFLVEELLSMMEDPSTSFSALVEFSKVFYEKTVTCVAIKSPENLIKGGRVQGLKKVLVNVADNLNIKIGVCIEDRTDPADNVKKGKIEMSFRAMTFRSLQEAMIKKILVKPGITRLAVAYSDDLDSAISFRKKLVEKLNAKGYSFKFEEVPILKVATSIRIHAGSGAIGVCAKY